MTDASPHGPHSQGDRSSFGFRDVDAREKVKMVRGVFDSVASNYDVMNDLMSVGVHRIWKDIAAAKLNPRPGETILDVAGGTGDMARRYSKMARRAQERRGGEDASVIVLDYNAEMILAGVHKGGEPEMSWSVGDAMALPLPDASVDCVTMAFGIRNILPRERAFAEMLRVLRPGGRACILEFGSGRERIWGGLYNVYLNFLLPRVGRLFSKDPAAYGYLADTIRAFPSAVELEKELRKTGFSKAWYQKLTSGIVCLHVGEKAR